MHSCKKRETSATIHEQRQHWRSTGCMTRRMCTPGNWCVNARDRLLGSAWCCERSERWVKERGREKRERARERERERERESERERGVGGGGGRIERFSKPNIRFGSGRTGSIIVSKFRLTHNRESRSANRKRSSTRLPSALAQAAENRGLRPKEVYVFFVKLCKTGGLLLPSLRSLVIRWPTPLAHACTDDGHVPADREIKKIFRKLAIVGIIPNQKKEFKKIIVSQVQWKQLQLMNYFDLVRLRINPRRSETWWQLDEVTRENCRIADTGLPGVCRLRHEVKPNRRFESRFGSRGLVDRNYRTVRSHYSILDLDPGHRPKPSNRTEIRFAKPL